LNLRSKEIADMRKGTGRRKSINTVVKILLPTSKCRWGIASLDYQPVSKDFLPMNCPSHIYALV
jgi:hypothetical protein